MKNLITIGLPSKGRLKEGSISFFEKNNLKDKVVNDQLGIEILGSKNKSTEDLKF